MSRHDRRRARRWSAAATAAAVGLAGWLLFFRGGGPDPGTAAQEPPKPPAKPEVKAAPPPGKKKEAPPRKIEPPPPPRVVAVSTQPEVKPEPAPKPAQGEPPWKHLLDTGRHHEARRYMAEAFAATDSDALRADLADRGLNLNRRLLIQQPDPRDIEFVTIAPGENPTTLSRRVKSLHGEPGLLFLLNGMRPGTVIRAGAKLRVARGTWSLLVDKSLFKLWLCYEGVPFKEYTVCVGMEDKTPAATWTVDVKNPKPDWTAPPEWLEKEGEKSPVIKYGHPKNPLGEYWIGLDAAGHMGFGIHGTNEPHTMGTKASNGCVRMLNAEVVELAACVWKGMTVTTVE